MKKTLSTSHKFTVLALTYLLIAVTTLFGAWVHTTLWSWFLTPTLGVEAPGLFMMCGLAVLLNSLFPNSFYHRLRDAAKRQLEANDLDDVYEGLIVLGGYLIVYIFALLTGSVYRLLTSL